ncbi:hypothetical protein DL765_009319 [Monosporascus sp. GIB2]|nr:hypothetical protein DL765_009319 [Monosporascus sp. GIB2]
MKEHEHQPFELASSQIRVVALLPDPEYYEEPRSSSQELPGPQYEALSYVWGTESETESVTAKIKPNYALRTMEVYRQAFLAYAEHYQRLTLLQHCNYPDPLFPSWVPNWASSIGFHASYYGCRASGISGARYAVLGDRLRVDAVRFAAVLKAETPDVQSMQGVLEFLLTIGTEKLQHTAYPAGGVLLEGYLQSFAFGRVKDRMPDIGNPSVHEWRELMDHQHPVHSRFEDEVVDRFRGKSVISLEGGGLRLHHLRVRGADGTTPKF